MAFDQLLKRHFWAVTLVLTGTAAFLGARGMTQLVGASLGADDKQLSAPPLVAKLPPTAGSASPHATSADAILTRNPFDSVTGPLNRAPAAEDVAIVPPPDMSDPFNAPDCDGVKVIIVAESPDPDWSFAAFSMGGGEKSKTILRRRGGEVNGKQVKFIGYNALSHRPAVWLTGGSVLCQSQMFLAPAASGSAPPPPPAQIPSAGAGAGPVPGDISKGIVKVSANEFNVDRGVVDKILENQAELMKQARIVPEQENGKVVGIRLFGVRPDTLLGTLGMENGDRLEKINGFDMTSPEKALEAYARLRTADHLTIQLSRRGQAMNVDYNIK
jgi:general secretion pathway protein C